jgi:hypothetical protein
MLRAAVGSGGTKLVGSGDGFKICRHAVHRVLVQVPSYRVTYMYLAVVIPLSAPFRSHLVSIVIPAA